MLGAFCPSAGTSERGSCRGRARVTSQVLYPDSGHREDLQAAPLRELCEDAVRLGKGLVGFEQDDAGVTARFVDGTGEGSTVIRPVGANLAGTGAKHSSHPDGSNVHFRSLGGNGRRAP